MENKLDNQLQLLNKLYKESNDIYNVAAIQLKLTDTAFWILYAISHTNTEYTQMDLCNEWFYPIQTVNSAITKLIKEDLVELEVIPGTKNRKKILLTKKGRDLVDNTIKKIDEAERQVFLMFTEEEREMYLSLMQKHIENLKNSLSEMFNKQ